MESQRELSLCVWLLTHHKNKWCVFRQSPFPPFLFPKVPDHVAGAALIMVVRPWLPAQAWLIHPSPSASLRTGLCLATASRSSHHSAEV